MSYKIYNSNILLIITIIISLFFIQCSEEKNKHQKYEEFLKKEYKKTSSLKDNKISPYMMQSGVAEASMQNYIMTLDPALQRVPTERLSKAQKETQLIRYKKKSSIISPLAWEEVASDMGGRTRALMFDPNTPNKVWAGAVTGGIFYNDNYSDENSSWFAISDNWENLTISSLAYDPNNTQIFYAGTGEGQTAVTIYRESSGRGSGIYKSTDGGENWEILPSTVNFAYVTDIEIKNEDGISVIYAGVISGVYKGATHQSTPSDGLYRSVDNGETWTQVLPNISETENPYAVADIEISSNGRIYIGTVGNLNGEGATTILYSDEGTAGTWTVFDDYISIIEGNSDSYRIPGRIMIASSPSNPNIVYAIVGAGSDEELIAGFGTFTGQYFLRSTDGGENWEVKTIPSSPIGDDRNWAYLSWHAFAIKVHPTEEDVVFIGGLEWYRTINGGENWKQISSWLGNYFENKMYYVHADQHILKFDPNDNSKAIIGTDEGVFYTETLLEEKTFESSLSLYQGNYYPTFYEDNVVKFKEINKNYNTLQFYTCAINDNIEEGEFVMGGTQDNGTLISSFEEPINHNNLVSGGDGAYCFFDNEEQMLISSTYHNQYTVIVDNVMYIIAIAT